MNKAVLFVAVVVIIVGTFSIGIWQYQRNRVVGNTPDVSQPEEVVQSTNSDIVWKKYDFKGSSYIKAFSFEHPSDWEVTEDASYVTPGEQALGITKGAVAGISLKSKTIPGAVIYIGGRQVDCGVREGFLNDCFEGVPVQGTLNAKDIFDRFFQSLKSPIFVEDMSWQLETKDWKVYRNQKHGFELRYPSGYSIDSHVNGEFDVLFTSHSGGSIHVRLEEINKNLCGLGFCYAPAKNEFISNGIKWAYLGDLSYGDAGSSVAYYVYRTFHDEFRFNVYFGKDSSENELVVKTFRFTR